MINPIRSLIRTSAFWIKEISEILRQPRLVLSLVLGPFLIMLLVGMGYRNQSRILRTLFVAEEGSPMASSVEDYVSNIGEAIDFAGVTANQEEALDRLRRGEVDIVVVTPSNPEDTIRNNMQAEFLLYHNEVDPAQVGYVSFVGELYVSEVNRRVLRTLTEQGQGEASSVQDDIEAARASARAMREALERGDAALARQHQGRLSTEVSDLQATWAAAFGLLGASTDTSSTGAGGKDSMANLQENSAALSDIREGQAGYSAEIRRLDQIESNLGELQEELRQFESMNSGVLVNPFRIIPQSIGSIQIRVIDYFAPAVLALLLQHVAVTFGALSIVRERQQGTLDFFRVSPLSAFEALLGKFTSYMLFTGLIGIVLAALMVFGLGVPMLGNWLSFALVMLTVIFASLGYGFVISLLASSDSHAVQFAMLTLLASVFFSGFFLPLYLLAGPVRVVSWSLPATYGMTMLQSIMLRGASPNPLLLLGLTAIGMLLGLIALARMRRLFAQQ
ncbi:MAG TPA: ABC transporter permease [Anaerolineales bacterium]|nr:ABC transporter permease [Anaerolineales bacterium]